jgi:hypothetical protein
MSRSSGYSPSDCTSCRAKCTADDAWFVGAWSKSRLAHLAGEHSQKNDCLPGQCRRPQYQEKCHESGDTCAAGEPEHPCARSMPPTSACLARRQKLHCRVVNPVPMPGDGEAGVVRQPATTDIRQTGHSLPTGYPCQPCMPASAPCMREMMLPGIQDYISALSMNMRRQGKVLRDYAELRRRTEPVSYGARLPAA